MIRKQRCILSVFDLCSLSKNQSFTQNHTIKMITNNSCRIYDSLFYCSTVLFKGRISQVPVRI